jgi:signal recognition particle receptor subunit beta
LRYKIIITGPVGAGKTTAINALTNEKALKTDVRVSDMTTSQRKETTTVALDYGVIKLNDEDVAHVYGTPGQERFDFMWDIISEGANGLVLLLDNCRNYPFRDLIYFTNQFRELIKNVPFIIGVTRSDIKNNPCIDTYRKWISELDISADILMVDARNQEHIHRLVKTMLDNKSQEPPETKKNETKETVPAETEVKTTNVSHTKEEKTKTATQETPVQESLKPSAKILLTEKSMTAVAKINGVTGVSLTNDMGELIDSTIADNDMNEFIAFLSGITPSIEDTANMGEIHRIMLRGRNDDNLTVFVEDERSLGVTSLQKTSVPALSQQIEDMLQWI